MERVPSIEVLTGETSSYFSKARISRSLLHLYELHCHAQKKRELLHQSRQRKGYLISV